MALGFIITKIIQLTVIKDLITNYVDTQLSKQDMMDKLEMFSERTRELQDLDLSYKLIPVSLPKHYGFEYAKVSIQDYDRIIGLAPIWRKSSSGYAITVQKDESIDKMKTIYMHKEIHGSQSKHVNGDRLDNRRENLVLSTRKRKKTDEMMEDFVLHTPRFMTFEAATYDSEDTDLKGVNGYAIVKFGKKTYSGEVRNGEPCGYGMISQNQAPYDMCGLWSGGKLTTGMITYYKPLPLAMDNEARLVTPREVVKVEIISNGNKIP